MSPPCIALIGDPVARSLSPKMQRAAFRAMGLDWRYEAITVRSDQLDRTWRRLRESGDCSGLNVTIPHKERIIGLLDRLDGAARRAGSVNTVLLDGGAAVGLSTDGDGFLAALRAADPGPHRRAVLLGTGGAARAVAAALHDAESEVTVLGRNERAGARLSADLGVRFLRWTGDAGLIRRVLHAADLLLNATPVGAGDPTASLLPPDVELDPALTVVDLVYRPRRTALLRTAQERGCTTVEGIEMLIEQGGLSFTAWTGLDAPISEMRAAAYAALDDQAA